MDTTDAATMLVDTYLNDLGRMLQNAEPELRSEVLGGVREHIQSALDGRPVPHTESDVNEILFELGPPEDVAAASLSGTNGDREPESLPDEQPSVAGPTPAPLLSRTWVPRTVGLLGLVGIGLYLAVLLAGALFSTAAKSEAASAASSANPVVPAFWEQLSVALAMLLFVVPLWLASIILVANSPLWSTGQKWLGIAILPTAVALNIAAIALASISDAQTLILISGVVVATAISAWMAVNTWKQGRASTTPELPAQSRNETNP
ncbi:HAAS signaling domain-containing protein [Arthrobacter castelli]|uniref:HAAS signaling domain-containing protein n=1 Tax=Arthrobacter castelli TaxID=271431 RepID=UPI00047CAFDD|nr:hypothetical protein [Arthrobacter castelli]